MPLVPSAVAVAASFTAGCALIHALRRHADSVSLALGVLACGLAVAVGSLWIGGRGLIGLPDPIAEWAFVPTAGI